MRPARRSAPGQRAKLARNPPRQSSVASVASIETKPAAARRAQYSAMLGSRLARGTWPKSDRIVIGHSERSARLQYAMSFFEELVAGVEMACPLDANHRVKMVVRKIQFGRVHYLEGAAGCQRARIRNLRVGNVNAGNHLGRIVCVNRLVEPPSPQATSRIRPVLLAIRATI